MEGNHCASVSTLYVKDVVIFNHSRQPKKIDRLQNLHWLKEIWRKLGRQTTKWNETHLLAVWSTVSIADPFFRIQLKHFKAATRKDYSPWQVRHEWCVRAARPHLHLPNLVSSAAGRRSSAELGNEAAGTGKSQKILRLIYLLYMHVYHIYFMC